jgi:mannose-6-phosphate isomerase-like protein (cupin superfamily)
MTVRQRSGTETLINYNGLVFRSAAPETADADGAGPIGHYRQDGDVVWAAFAGGKVVRGALVGRCDSEGVLELTYSQLLRTGEVIAGRCTSVPTVLEDGRVRLHEHWQRLWPELGTGVSIIEEPPPPANRAARQTGEDGSVMQVIAGAGVYTPAADSEPNHWVEHLVTKDLSVGTYSIPAGGLDDQRPHYEDEIYVVQTGAATLVTSSGSAEVEPGSVVFVPAREKHQFTDIREDLTLIVIVAPPYKSREPAEAGQTSAAAAGASVAG